MTLTSLPRYHFNQLNEVFADLDGGVPQDDGPGLVCKIDYPPHFAVVYDLFRGILQRNETTTERVLGLTCLCVEQNAANYTVWHVRRQCLLATTPSSEENSEGNNDSIWASTTSLPEWLPLELQFTAELGGSNPKNYQIWYHRRSLLQALFDRYPPTEQEDLESSLVWQHSVKELEYLDSVFRADAKNYHAWSHRQFLVLLLAKEQEKRQPQQEANDIWDSEMLSTQQLIQTDVRNNSAWNHRWFILHQGSTKPKVLEPEKLEKELEYVLSQIALDVYNESSCRYMVALLKEQKEPIPSYLPKLEALREQHNEKLKEQQESLGDSNSSGITLDDASTLLSALADLYQAVQSVDAALALVVQLKKVDPIRTKYWNWRSDQLSQMMQAK